MGPGRRLRPGTAAPATGPGARSRTHGTVAATLPGQRRQHSAADVQIDPSPAPHLLLEIDRAIAAGLWPRRARDRAATTGSSPARARTRACRCWPTTRTWAPPSRRSGTWPKFRAITIHSIGSTFPGLPAIVIGHNEQIAWGVTNVGPDVQDLYVERINPANPNQYEVDGTWEDMAIVEELIAVDGEDEPLRWAARSTRHGPLISDVSDMGSPLALRWTALRTRRHDNGCLPGRQLCGQLGSSSPLPWRMFITPSQNFVYADVQRQHRLLCAGHDSDPRRRGMTACCPCPAGPANTNGRASFPLTELAAGLQPAGRVMWPPPTTASSATTIPTCSPTTGRRPTAPSASPS